LATAFQEIEASGAGAIGIATAAPDQAQALIDGGIPFPLLLDREMRTYDALGIGRQSLLGFISDYRGWGRWMRGFLRNRRQGRITADYSVLSGVAIADAEGEIVWIHRGEGLGDYPRLERVLARLRELTGSV